MRPRWCRWLAGIWITIFLDPCGIRNADAKSPNIVVILADDFGVGDIQAHYPQNKIPTPHLDRLVQQGMSFTDAHSPSAVCTPSRYGLLTGRYCWRTQLQEWVLASYEPPLIAADRQTLPGFLNQHGYQTACVGKWHLGWNWPGPQLNRKVDKQNALLHDEWDFSKPVKDGPTKRGFDYYFGTDVPNFPPFTFLQHDRVAPLPTEVLDTEASRLKELVLSTSLLGTPMAPGWKFDRILPELTSHAVDYIHQHAKQDAPFFLYFAMTSPHEPIAPSREFAGKSGIAPIADFLMETDWSAGQVIKAIDEAGIADETIIIFTADNGHSHYTGWDRLIQAGHFPSGPFRGHKGDIWEGGHRVPFVIRWPGKILAGSSSDQMLCLTDLFATFAELLEQALPENAAEDSFSFLSTVLGKNPGPGKTTAEIVRSEVVSHSVDGEFAYRKGDWKIVFKINGKSRADARGQPTVVELFNLVMDVPEEQNMATQHPEIVEELTRKLQALIDRGRSNPGNSQSNDRKVRFDVMQAKRWATD